MELNGFFAELFFDTLLFLSIFYYFVFVCEDVYEYVLII